MKLWVLLACFVAIISLVAAYPATQADIDAEIVRQMIGRALAKAKRSPSIGLSLADYMAGPAQGGENLHFLNGRK